MKFDDDDNNENDDDDVANVRPSSNCNAKGKLLEYRIPGS